MKNPEIQNLSEGVNGGLGAKPPEAWGSEVGAPALGNFYIISTKIMHF